MLKDDAKVVLFFCKKKRKNLAYFIREQYLRIVKRTKRGYKGLSERQLQSAAAGWFCEFQ